MTVSSWFEWLGVMTQVRGTAAFTCNHAFSVKTGLCEKSYHALLTSVMGSD